MSGKKGKPGEKFMVTEVRATSIQSSCSPCSPSMHERPRLLSLLLMLQVFVSTACAADGHGMSVAMAGSS